MTLWKRIRNVLTGARQAEQLAQMNRRLERLEAQGDTLHKIWLRTRHLEPAMQSLLRARYVDPASLPYPERLISQRFRLSSQNQEDGLTLALLHEAGPTTRGAGMFRVERRKRRVSGPRMGLGGADGRW